MTYGEFTAQLLEEPIRYTEVAEGTYQTGTTDSRYSHIATFGIYTCKALAFHDSESGRGLLAHIDSTSNVRQVLDTVIAAYDQTDFSQTDIKLLRANAHPDESAWPSIDTIADELATLEPKSLLLDRNQAGHAARAVALSLSSGVLYEIQRNSPAIRRSAEVLARSKPLRGRDTDPQ